MTTEPLFALPATQSPKAPSQPAARGQFREKPALFPLPPCQWPSTSSIRAACLGFVLSAKRAGLSRRCWRRERRAHTLAALQCDQLFDELRAHSTDDSRRVIASPMSTTGQHCGVVPEAGTFEIKRVDDLRVVGLDQHVTGVPREVLHKAWTLEALLASTCRRRSDCFCLR